MFTREDHRHFAVECLRFAAEAEDDREWHIFLEMAEAWTGDAWTVFAFEDSFSYRTRFAIGVGDERAERTTRYSPARWLCARTESKRGVDHEGCRINRS